MMKDIEYLYSLGFNHIYRPELKKVDKNRLNYTCMFSAGNSINIELSFIDKLHAWELNYISFVGEFALNIIKSDIQNYSMSAVLSFVKKYPSQSF